MFILLGIGISALLLGAGGAYLMTRGGGDAHNAANVEAHGAINNVVVTDFQDHVEIKNREMMILLSIMCVIKVVEFLYFIYNRRVIHLKRKYEERQARNTPNQV